MRNSSNGKRENYFHSFIRLLCSWQLFGRHGIYLCKLCLIPWTMNFTWFSFDLVQLTKALSPPLSLSLSQTSTQRTVFVLIVHRMDSVTSAPLHEFRWMRRRKWVAHTSNRQNYFSGWAKSETSLCIFCSFSVPWQQRNEWNISIVKFTTLHALSKCIHRHFIHRCHRFISENIFLSAFFTRCESHALDNDNNILKCIKIWNEIRVVCESSLCGVSIRFIFAMLSQRRRILRNMFCLSINVDWMNGKLSRRWLSERVATADNL